MTLTAGSLFSGVGMFDLAFAAAGFDILFQVEIDTFCQKVLKKHAPTYWPHAEVHADVCRVGRDTLPSVDVLFGGFPCTDISVAGKGEGIQVGTRSGLWFEFKRIIGDIRPRVVLLENVAAITGRDGVKVIGDLTALGYDCRWGVISASEVGAPHLRERWWCVAFSVGHTPGERRKERQCQSLTAKTSGKANSQRFSPHQMDDSNSERCEKINLAGDRNTAFVGRTITINGDEGEWPPNKPRLGGSLDGTATRMDGYRLMSHVFPVGPNMPQPDTEAPRMAPGNKNTNNRLKALGNGGLPQIVYPIACEIRALLERKPPTGE